MVTGEEFRRHQAAGMAEEELQQAIRELARMRGCLYYHTRDSRGSDPGLPDCIIVGPDGVLWRELKRENGRLRQGQLLWLDTLERAGCDVGVWRPTDLLDGAVDAQIQAIATRPTRSRT